MNARIAAPARRSWPRAALAALGKRFGQDRRGSAAVEFGLVAVPFLRDDHGDVRISMLFLTGQALDTSLDEAARQLLTGQAQTSSGTTAITDMATFKTYAFCPKLPAIITCSQVQLNVSVVNTSSLGAPISNGVLDTSSWVISPARPGRP